MKQLFLTFSVLLSFLSVTAMADNERIITFNELPKASQTFLNTYYADATIQYYKVKVCASLVIYTANFTEGREVQFGSNGRWTEVKSRKTAIPDGIVPAKIKTFVKTYFPSSIILKIEHNARFYEVTLDNDIEITFNRSLRAIDINY